MLVMIHRILSAVVGEYRHGPGRRAIIGKAHACNGGDGGKGVSQIAGQAATHTRAAGKAGSINTSGIDGVVLCQMSN